MRNIKSMTAAAMLTVVLAGIAPVAAQTEIASSSDCLRISVNTKDAPQLSAAINVCTSALGRNDLSANTRTELLVHRGVAYRNVGDLNKSLGDLSAARDLYRGPPGCCACLGGPIARWGRAAEAENEYGRALKLEPASAGIPVSLFRAVRHEEAQGRAWRLRGSARCRPERGQHYLTARLYHMLGRPSSARPLLEGAIGTPIESGRIYGLLAEIYHGRPTR